MAYLNRHFGGLYDEFRFEGLPKYFNITLLVRRLLTAFVLVFLYNYPKTEICILMFLNLLGLYLGWHYLPYKLMRDNFNNVATEGAFMIIHIVIGGFVFDDFMGVFTEE